MKPFTFILLSILSLAVSTLAQQTQSSTTQAHSKSSPSASACKTLATTAALVDGAFDGKTNEPRMLAPMLSDPDDPIWNILIECSEATKKPFQSAEALRVAAMWERLRADMFRKMYLERMAAVNTSPALSPSPSAAQAVDDGIDFKPNSAPNSLPVDFDGFDKVFRNEAPKQNKQQDEILTEALRDSSILILNTDDHPISVDAFTRVAAHNRALCDQVITVTRLGPGGLSLEYGSPAGRKWLAKKYPRACLLEDTAHFAPGVPRYLLVYAVSRGAFAGFQPVQQTTHSVVSGTGTATNASGGMWNFSYHGTMDTSEAVVAPYTITSQSVFLYAYDENGRVVSQHSTTSSTQTGGDAAYAAGYNTGNLIAQLLNNPQRLATRVLKDVQNDLVRSTKK